MGVGFAPRVIFGAVVGCIGVCGWCGGFWRSWLAVVGWFDWLGLYVGALPQAPFFLELVGRGSWLAVVGWLDWLTPTYH